MVTFLYATSQKRNHVNQGAGGRGGGEQRHGAEGFRFFFVDFTAAQAEWPQCGTCSASSTPDPSLGQHTKEHIVLAVGWIFKKSGVCTSEWVTCLKMNANLAAVRGVPGRSLDGSQCRHGCPETETLAHVQGLKRGVASRRFVNQEKINVYLPTVDYFKAKYQLQNIEVIGLLIGARGVIPKFFERFRKTFELPQTLTTDIITSVLKRSCQILSRHIHSV
ncbi:hypothetical protein ANN_11829 [Periplaneta americana]|uniref:Uncharacterized protein n=1 Tax=Periplaneta americana TaxID=6978 RepID=A0ABQ8T7X2_PERAM|nr:hypothetical protein ANN_11829 [Periplaneta americana]